MFCSLANILHKTNSFTPLPPPTPHLTPRLTPTKKKKKKALHNSLFPSTAQPPWIILKEINEKITYSAAEVLSPLVPVVICPYHRSNKVLLDPVKANPSRLHLTNAFSKYSKFATTEQSSRYKFKDNLSWWHYSNSWTEYFVGSLSLHSVLIRLPGWPSRIFYHGKGSPAAGSIICSLIFLF